MTYAIYPSLRERVVFISGGSSGIGAELVRAFAAQGARVAFCGTKPDGGDGADRRGRRRRPRRAVVRRLRRARRRGLPGAAGGSVARRAGPDPRARQQRRPRRSPRDGRGDAASSGTIASRSTSSTTSSRSRPWRRGWRAAGGGSVVNMGSVSWMRGRPNLVGYTTAKAGILGLTRTLARELGPRNIRVNALVPGAIVTERQTTLHRDPAADQEFLDAQCLKIRLDPGPRRARDAVPRRGRQRRHDRAARAGRRRASRRPR